jgi:hypothetical protein
MKQEYSHDLFSLFFGVWVGVVSLRRGRLHTEEDFDLLHLTISHHVCMRLHDLTIRSHGQLVALGQHIGVGHVDVLVPGVESCGVVVATGGEYME